jgi:hypothetical protein
MGIVDIGAAFVGDGFDSGVRYGFVSSWSRLIRLLNRYVGLLSARLSELVVIYADST